MLRSVRSIIAFGLEVMLCDDMISEADYIIISCPLASVLDNIQWIFLVLLNGPFDVRHVTVSHLKRRHPKECIYIGIVHYHIKKQTKWCLKLKAPFRLFFMKFINGL